MDGKRLVATAVADREGSDGRRGRKRLLGVALLDVCLFAALLFSGCGAGGMAGKAANHGASKGGAGSAAYGGLGHLPQGREQVMLDPADFTTRIDNPYWPMAPGDR